MIRCQCANPKIQTNEKYPDERLQRGLPDRGNRADPDLMTNLTTTRNTKLTRAEILLGQVIRWDQLTGFNVPGTIYEGFSQGLSRASLCIERSLQIF